MPFQKKSPRKKFIYNLTTARKVGIVFEGSITGMPEEIKVFMQYLKGLNLDVYAIGFVDIKELLPLVWSNILPLTSFREKS